MSISQDITARRQTELDLRHSADRLTLAVRAGGVGIWDFDVVHNRLTWDDQMFHLYGLKQDHRNNAFDAWQAGIIPTTTSGCDEEIQSALNDETDFDTEFRVIWPDGSTHFIRGIAVVYRDDEGQPLRMIGTNWDITAVKAMETELRTAARARQAHRAAQSRPARRPPAADWCSAPNATRIITSPCCSSTLTGSKPLTTASATTSATPCSNRSPCRLRTITRSGDSLSAMDRENTSARLGGDEFVVLLDGLAKPEDAYLVASRLLEAFALAVPDRRSQGALDGQYRHRHQQHFRRERR